MSKPVSLSFLIPCPQASWQPTPHLVRKDFKSLYRAIIDLRPVNAATKAEKWPMPMVEAMLSDFKDSKHFASLDFCVKYWKCLLNPKSYDACRIIAPQGTVVSTRVLHGLENTSANFQFAIPPLFPELKDTMKAWSDDFIIHARTELELLNYLEKCFHVCSKYNLRLSAKKFLFYSKEVRWCGRIIDSEGYKLDPRNIECIRNMEPPVNAMELCQFTRCGRWMSTVTPDLHRKVHLLSEILEKAYKQAGKCRKISLKNISLSKLSCDNRHATAFASIQDSLQNTVKLTFPE